MTETKEGYYLWDHTNHRSIPTATPDGEPDHFFVTPEMASGCAVREMLESPTKKISIRRTKGDPEVDADFSDDFILRLEI